MSKDYNRVILLGRLARDPETRDAGNGRVARFTICTGRQWKNKQTGEIQSHTDFISVTAWGGIAKVVEQYTRKGSQILIEGRISTREYDDKSGTHKWVTEVTADNITLLSDNRAQAQPTMPHGNYSMRQGGEVQGGAFDDDFPLDFADFGEDSAGAGEVKIPF